MFFSYIPPCSKFLVNDCDIGLIRNDVLNKKLFVLVWITMIFNWLIGTTANWRIPNEKVQIQNSVRTYPQVHNCVLVHLLIKLNFKVGGGEYFTVWNSLFGKSRYWFTNWAWYGRVENRRCLMIQGSFRNV